MLELQYFKKEVCQRVGKLLTMTRDVSATQFLLVADDKPLRPGENPVFKNVLQRNLSDNDMYATKVAAEGLREIATSMSALISCLVYKQWAISWVDEKGVSRMRYFNYVYKENGAPIDVILALMKEFGQVRMERLVQFVFEYPVGTTGPYGYFGKWKGPCYLTGSTTINWQCKLSAVGLEFVSSQEVGTEHGDKMNPNMLGRDVIGYPIEHTKIENPDIWSNTHEDMLALLQGSIERV
jgi:hypothetical protein